VNTISKLFLGATIIFMLYYGLSVEHTIYTRSIDEWIDIYNRLEREHG